MDRTPSALLASVAVALGVVVWALSVNEGVSDPEVRRVTVLREVVVARPGQIDRLIEALESRPPGRLTEEVEVIVDAVEDGRVIPATTAPHPPPPTTTTTTTTTVPPPPVLTWPSPDAPEVVP